uniref:Uncharacterized protein n=1 Tax=Clastoptera arizonana TaxID=38151 RepID=A0A1B6CWI1_9HEMI
MALYLVLHQICGRKLLEGLWILFWVTSITNGSTLLGEKLKKNLELTSSELDVLSANSENFNFSGSKVINVGQTDGVFSLKNINNEDQQKSDDVSITSPNIQSKVISPKTLFQEENKQKLDEKDKINFQSKEEKKFPGYNFSIKNNTFDSKHRNNDPFSSSNNFLHSNHSFQKEIEKGDNFSTPKSFLDSSPTNKSTTKPKLTEAALFNKYLISERKKAASTLPTNKQKVFYQESSLNESSLMNDQPVQTNTSEGNLDVSIKSSSNNEEDDVEVIDHNNMTLIDEALNETIFNNTSSQPIGRIMTPSAGIGFNTILITGVSLAVVILGGIMAAGSYVFYRHRYWNKPQTLSDKCSNADSSGYIDDSTLRENSEEMYSLDNDSFLNSLEAMTIQNYWTDNVKHTKL